MKLRSLSTLFLLCVLATSAESKGQVTRVTVDHDALSAPIEISDARLLDRFNPWAGPGAWSEGVQQTSGFIIDWKSGSVPAPPDNRNMFRVRFYVKHHSADPEKLAYTVTYAYVPSDRNHEAVYLPGKEDPHYTVNVTSIIRGVEGSWFRPTSEWQGLIRPLIDRALSR